MVEGKKKEFLEFMLNSIVALLLIISGIGNLSAFPKIGFITIFLGCLILIYNVVSRLLKFKSNYFKGSVTFVESISLLLTSYIYFSLGKKYLPFALLLASAGYLIATVVFIVRILKLKKAEGFKQ